MISYLVRRILYALPIMLGVAFICFMLVHIAPGDPRVRKLFLDRIHDGRNGIRHAAARGYFRSQFATGGATIEEGKIVGEYLTSRPDEAGPMMLKARLRECSGAMKAVGK